MSKQDVSISKFLSLVLRHRPDAVGVELDANGWIEVDTLLAALATHGKGIGRAELERIVSENDKQRFVFSEGGERIRANQGHSVEVDLALRPQTPPEVLFHGTVERFRDAIFREGLQKRQRHHVHMSQDLTTATKVGERRGKPIILEIAAGEMHRAGHTFFLSENGVWLVDEVPPAFFKQHGEFVNTTAQTVKRLFRPVGLNELKLVHDSGMMAFPPRLPEQTIFYSVLNQAYAAQIARDWNAKYEPDRIGFVTGFFVEEAYAARYPIQTVGGREHKELWVPAEELAEFNRRIVGQIEVCDVFRGEGCVVEIDEIHNLPKAWITTS